MPQPEGGGTRQPCHFRAPCLSTRRARCPDVGSPCQLAGAVRKDPGARFSTGPQATFPPASDPPDPSSAPRTTRRRQKARAPFPSPLRHPDSRDGEEPSAQDESRFLGHDLSSPAILVTQVPVSRFPTTCLQVAEPAGQAAAPRSHETQPPRPSDGSTQLDASRAHPRWSEPEPRDWPAPQPDGLTRRPRPPKRTRYRRPDQPSHAPGRPRADESRVTAHLATARPVDRPQDRCPAHLFVTQSGRNHPETVATPSLRLSTTPSRERRTRSGARLSSGRHEGSSRQARREPVAPIETRPRCVPPPPRVDLRLDAVADHRMAVRCRLLPPQANARKLGDAPSPFDTGAHTSPLAVSHVRMASVPAQWPSRWVSPRFGSTAAPAMASTFGCSPRARCPAKLEMGYAPDPGLCANRK